jgi:hypothetical protein
VGIHVCDLACGRFSGHVRPGDPVVAIGAIAELAILGHRIVGSQHPAANRADLFPAPENTVTTAAIVGILFLPEPIGPEVFPTPGTFQLMARKICHYLHAPVTLLSGHFWHCLFK